MGKQKGTTATTEARVEERDVVQITSDAFKKLPPEAQEIVRSSVIAQPTLVTYGHLRQALAKGNYRWSTVRGSDETPLPSYTLGAKTADLLEAAEAPKIDVAALVKASPPANPLLREHLIGLKILPSE